MTWLFIRRILKLSISIVYFLIITFYNIFIRVFNKFPPERLLILMYHSVHFDEKDKFNKHIQFARKVGIQVFPDIDSPLVRGRRHIAITFDDGFSNFYHNALPVLKTHNVPSTVFVPTGFIGSKQGWIKNQSHPNYDETIMSKAQLLDLPSDLVRVGSHCQHHLPLDKLDKGDIQIEIKKSKHLLEIILGREIRLLSLPHGSFTPDIEMLSLEAGYDRVFLGEPIVRSTNFKDVFKGRIDVTLNDWPIEYKLKYLGAYHWERYSFKIKNVLKLNQHRN